PRLLICDEPTSALDPVGRKEVLDVLKRISGGTTVIFSTHILADVERVCDRAAVLHGGKIVLNGTLAELKAGHGQGGLRIEFASAEDKNRFRELFGVHGHEAGVHGHEAGLNDETVLTINAPEAQHLAALRALAGAGIVPIRFELLEPTIESLYLEALGKEKKCS
ncbi:MAG: ABC transporter ATP-binding protein, partial [Oscillospiraceae bacterium]|nr:ABC transporter ATP-binding protein [Oscillospiraceae bacterium]